MDLFGEHKNVTLINYVYLINADTISFYIYTVLSNRVVYINFLMNNVLTILNFCFTFFFTQEKMEAFIGNSCYYSLDFIINVSN